MILAPITSLADLFNKAKVEKSYNELILITARSFTTVQYYPIKTLEAAIECLENLSKLYGTCKAVVARANDLREKVGVKDLPPPTKAQNARLITTYDELVATVEANRPLFSRFERNEMAEYGWYDQEIEDEIDRITTIYNVTRDEALYKIFNER